MNGTLKSWLGLSGVWAGALVAWICIVAAGAMVAGKGMGPMLTAAMGVAWLSALVLGLAALALGKRLVWRWMPAGGGRQVMLVLFAVGLFTTFLWQAFSVFVIFNR